MVKPIVTLFVVVGTTDHKRIEELEEYEESQIRGDNLHNFPEEKIGKESVNSQRCHCFVANLSFLKYIFLLAA